MSTDQISTASNGITSQTPVVNSTPGLSNISGVLQGSLNNLTNLSSSLLDKILPPAKRESIKKQLSQFATEKPLLASFLLSQVALSGLPIALFVILAITVGIFALLTGILVGVIGALLFLVFALGVALFVLLPTLFVSTFFAVAVWLWCVCGYYVIKWFNEKSVPGIHGPLKEGLMEKSNGLGKLMGLTTTTSETDEQQTKEKETSKLDDKEQSKGGKPAAAASARQRDKPQKLKSDKPAVAGEQTVKNVTDSVVGNGGGDVGVDSVGGLTKGITG